MRKMIGALLVALTLVLGGGAVFGGSAVASHTHPFCGSGNEFSQSHIVPLAQESGGSPTGGLGNAGGHVPGFHQGFAVCLDLHE